MNYEYTAIPESELPRAVVPLLQHAIETYLSETNKVASTWRGFEDNDLDWKPHARSSTVREILRHQLLSERRFFGEFLQTPEPDPSAVLPSQDSVDVFISRFIELARPRLTYL